MSQRVIRHTIIDMAKEAYAAIKAASAPEERMQIALQAIHDMHDYMECEACCDGRDDWQELYEAREWVDVYVDLVDVTEQLSDLALGKEKDQTVQQTLEEGE